MPDVPVLPVAPTPFVGRAAEVETVGKLLGRRDVRLVTVLGPAGVGKTRLAIEVARQASQTPTVEVVFVPLADVRDAALVPAALLRAVGAADVGSRPAFDRLVDVLADREILLVLDNVEQIVDCGGCMADLVGACPRLTVLVTSRRPLAVRAERCVHLEPFAVPGSARISADEARRSDAVALLVARLEAVDARFHLTDADVPVVVAICGRLDGLPLAIELAAARSRALSLAAILDALDKRLPLLSGGNRDQPARQRTMSDAVAWSYDLLDSRAAALFRRLGACAGGATLTTVAALAEDLELADIALFDVLHELISHSLVQRRDDAGDSRYAMLEVVREFAEAQLADEGEDEAVRRRHARHFLQLAEQAAANFAGREQAAWLDRVQRDAANLTAAIRWATDDNDADLALRMCLSLRFLWYVRGSIAEGRALFDSALHVAGASPSVRARALVEAGALARHHGDFQAAHALVSEGLAIARSTGDDDLLSSALLQHGFVLHLIGAYSEARTSLEQSLAICHAMDNQLGVARAAHHLGIVAYFADHDLGLAWEMQCRCLALFRELGNERHEAAALITMGDVARARGELHVARDLLSEGLRRVSRLGDTPLVVHALHNAAALAADQHQPNRALRLLGAAEGLERSSGAAPWPAVAAGRDRWLPIVERTVGRRRAAAVTAAGQHLGVDDAVALATAADAGVDDPLTRREIEIAELVADGLTNRAIADRLVISERTVDGHLGRILTKLDFSSRSQIAAWVAGKTGTR